MAASSTTEAALVQALLTNTPEALLRLLTSSSTAEPDAAAKALLEALGKQDALAKALEATTAARRAVASLQLRVARTRFCIILARTFGHLQVKCHSFAAFAPLLRCRGILVCGFQTP